MTGAVEYEQNYASFDKLLILAVKANQTRVYDRVFECILKTKVGYS